MQWFKHDADASTDAKIKKLVMRYGADGYAIYFHCIELIVGNLSEQNITFELEHDAEIIADNLKIQGTSDTSPVDRVNQIMRFIVGLGLFEESNGHITCYKILKRLDSSMTSNIKMRNIITNAKKSHATVMINHDSVMSNPDGVMQEENRIDKIRIDNNTQKAKANYSKTPKEKISANKPESVSQEVWDEYVSLRKQKRTTVTPLVIKGIEREAEKAGISLEVALTTCIERGWQGFKADWIKPTGYDGKGGKPAFRIASDNVTLKDGEINF
jgi:hypothetical protein